MKKLILFVVFITFSCKTPQYVIDENIWWNKNLLLNMGMNKQNVINTFGMPFVSNFENGVEEWHYCKNSGGYRTYQYIALYFKDDKLITKSNYTVTGEEYPSLVGGCRQFIKLGSYRVPDEIIELRGKIKIN